jgi:hypothetical protein
MGPGGPYLKGQNAITAEWDLQTSRKLGRVVTPTDRYAQIAVNPVAK